MAPGSLREIGQVNNLGLKVHRKVFPDGGITTRGTVQVTSALGLKTPQGLHALFQGDEQGVPREEVPPGPRISQGSHRKTIAQGMDREGGFSKQRRRRERRDAGDRVSLGQVHTEFRRLGIGYENRDRGECRSDTRGDKKSWTVSLSHAVTSLAKEVGGERSEVTRAESGICMMRGVSS